MRTWNEGDAEPLDVAKLIDSDGDTWINLEPNSWYEEKSGEYCAVSWADVVEYGPLHAAGVDVKAAIADELERIVQVVGERNQDTPWTADDVLTLLNVRAAELRRA